MPFTIQPSRCSFVYCRMFSSGTLKDVLSKFFHLDSLMENLSGYVEARVQLLKHEVREEVAKAMTRILVLAALVLLAILVIVFFSLGLALYLSQVLGAEFAGFLVVGGFYLLLLLLSIVMKKQLFQSLERFLNRHLEHLKD